MVLNYAPDERRTYGGTGVGEHIVEGDDARQVRDAGGEHRVDAPETGKGFADNRAVARQRRSMSSARKSSKPRPAVERAIRWAAPCASHSSLAASSPIMEAGKAAASPPQCGGSDTGSPAPPRSPGR